MIAEQILKRAIMDSVGLTIRHINAPPPVSFQYMTPIDIINTVRANYGKTTTRTVRKLDEILAKKLDSRNFPLDKRGDCIYNFMTYNVSGFTHRPSYEEILQQQDDSSEQLEITAMMIQSATNESSNTTEEGSSSSEVESQPKHGQGSLVQQVARRVEAYMRFAGVSDAMMPRIMDTKPPSLWFRAIRATVAHITSSHPDNHVLDFMQEDIPPATTDLNDHNALTNLWAQKIFTEEKLSTLLESSLDIDIDRTPI